MKIAPLSMTANDIRRSPVGVSFSPTVGQNTAIDSVLPARQLTQSFESASIRNSLSRLAFSPRR